MSTPLFHYLLIHWLIAFIPLALGVFVVSRNPNNPLYWAFLRYNFVISWWGAFNLFMEYSPNDAVALFWDRISLVGIVFIPAAFIHFTWMYSGRSRLYDFVIKCCYGLSTFFLFLAFTPYMARSATPKYIIPYFTDPGTAYHFFIIYFTFIMGLGNLLVLNAWRKCRSDKKRTGIFLFFLATSIATIGGGGNFMVPYQIYTPFLFPYGGYAFIFYGVLISYVILKHSFFDMEVIVKKTLVFAGLFGVIMAAISIVTVIAQGYLGQMLGMGPMTRQILNVLVAIALFDPTRKHLIYFTDAYLFQKEKNFRIVLKKLSESVITILDLKDVSRAVLMTFKDTMRLESGAIFLLNETNNEYELLDSFGSHKRKILFRSDHPFLKSLKVVGMLNLDQEKTGIQGVECPEVEELKPSFVMALWFQNELIGMLFLGKKKSDQAFTQDEIDYFPTVASQTAIALKNALLVDDVVQEREAKIRAQAIAKFVNYSKSIRHEIKNVVSKIYLPAEYFKVLDEFFYKLIKKTEEGFADNRKAEIVKKMIMEKKEPLIRYSNTLILAGDQITLAANTASSAFSDDPSKFSIIYFRILWDAAKEEANLEDCDCGANYADDYSVFGNLYLLQRVFVNLLNNSKDAMKDQKNKQITVNCSTRIREGGQEVSWFEFQDNGPGIPPEIADKIFEQDFSTKPKPDDADPKASGYGQGLYVCKTTIEDQHLGKIWVDREAKGGAKFIFWLPKKKSKE